MKENGSDSLLFERIGNSKLVIIEGIPGSGKDSIQSKIVSHLEQIGKKVYNYKEEDVLFTWKVGELKEIIKIRLKFMNSLLSFMQQRIKDDDNIVFVVNRFHLSLAYLARKNKPGARSYDEILAKIKKIKSFVVVCVLKDEEIESRSAHHERKDIFWQENRQRKLANLGYTSFFNMYKDDQDLILKLAKDQNIPFMTYSLNLNK